MIKEPAEFYLEYKLGVTKARNDRMTLGSIFSACYQNRKIDPKEMLNYHRITDNQLVSNFIEVLNRLPIQTNGHPEYPMIAEYMGWKFRATLDDYVAQSRVIIENKTGQATWNQMRVDNDFQLTFQAWSHWKKTGELPSAIYLNWWNTKNKRPTLKVFKTSRSISALKNFERLLTFAVKKIEADDFSDY